MDEGRIPSPAPRFSILAVDDEKANLNLLRRTFHNDYRLHLAENGFDGLEILKQHPIDLIITDQRMPRMTGVEMLVKSQQFVPDAVRIVLTAYSDVQDIIEAINQGQIYRYILKPWSPDDLKLTVGKALQHYALQKENRELVVQLRRSLEELKAAQEQLLHAERLSTLGRAASTIIHDLKLPMSNIRASAQLLAKSDLPESMRAEFSRMVVREIDRLVDMTKEILYYSRGEMQMNIETFNLDDLLSEALRIVQSGFAEAQVTVRRTGDQLGEIRGDRQKLVRVVLNLLTNSRDAMPKGGAIEVEGTGDDHTVTLRIRDTGSGIPAEILDRVFTPFVTFGKHNGTGLGLTIAKNIVEAHGGKIAIGNRPGGGAEAIITLPRNASGRA